ncbi:hypothetical protein HGRIS_012625 [Hohenbuehelia grisea]|uniref:RING-type domain-containing protein n=1 Tax=Hohenbuehelia grisea TaxID=104357 RepID=A0ABR3ISV4_9AGAR
MSSAYNLTLSLNFTSLLNFPARIFARMRKVDDILAAVDNTQLNDVIPDSVLPSLESVGMSATALPSQQAAVIAQKASNFQQFPGPWGFFTSGYAFGLFMMAVLLHRIQNIVVPPGELSANQLNRHHTDNSMSHGRSLARKLYARLLPLDLSNTSTRLVFHLPSLYFLSKMLLLWILILLQTANILDLPSDVHGTDLGETSAMVTFNSWAWVRTLALWSSGLEMEEVCWKTFCAVCAAFCVEALVKGLDGAGLGLAAHMNANTSPFNLVGYAFLLHIYSSPITHPNKYESLPSRPDKHVVVTIAIPLLQLTIFHILSIRKKWSHHRLLPTALASFLSLTHFHLTLWSHTKSASSSSISAALPNTSGIPQPIKPHYQLHQPPHATYPLLNYIPNIFESLLLLTTLLTIALNALTQLLLTGRVDRPLVGLGLGGGSSGNWPLTLPYDEDFGVLLLRVGTASLEATGLRGWGNEVGGVVAPSGSRDSSSLREEKVYGTIGMGRSGVTWMQHSYTVTGTNNERTGPRRRRIGAGKGRASGSTSKWRGSATTSLQRGWENEIRTVASGSGSPSPYGISSSSSAAPSWWVPGIGAGSRGIGGDWRWYAEMIRFFWGVYVVFKGTIWCLWMILRRRRVSAWMSGEGSEGEDTSEGEVTDFLPVDEGVDHDNLYDKFLSGRLGEEDDDHDDDWAPDAAEDYPYSDEEDDTDVEPTDDDAAGEHSQEAVFLYSDLASQRHIRFRSPSLSPTITHATSAFSSQFSPSPTHSYAHPDESISSSYTAASTSMGAAPVLLAHMTHDGSSPLTRRRYTSLLHGASGVTEDIPTQKTKGKEKSPSTLDESRRNCVVCTVEAREIICWPCRCLALCDECRESLASRSAASKHRCPCCRRTVEGYSRIFIP